MTGDLVPILRGKLTEIKLVDLQEQLDARGKTIETRPGSVTKKARTEAARREFEADPLTTLVKIQEAARKLADVFDGEITADSTPLTQEQADTLSEEYLQLDQLKTQLAALEERYRKLIFSHLDKTLKEVPGRPLSHTPGKVETKHYVFERRGGNRANPSLDTESMRDELPPEIAAQLYKLVHHEPVEAWDEEVFDEGRFDELVRAGVIDLDLVAQYLAPGERRTPSFYKTLVDGD